MKKTLIIAATLLAVGSASSLVLPSFAQDTTNANGEATASSGVNANGGAAGCEVASSAAMGTTSSSAMADPNLGCNSDNAASGASSKAAN
jgi:hypothetical protein